MSYIIDAGQMLGAWVTSRSSRAKWIRRHVTIRKKVFATVQWFLGYAEYSIAKAVRFVHSPRQVGKVAEKVYQLGGYFVDSGQFLIVLTLLDLPNLVTNDWCAGSRTRCGVWLE